MFPHELGIQISEATLDILKRKWGIEEALVEARKNECSLVVEYLEERLKFHTDRAAGVSH